jgi:hypothetical protein
MKKVFLTFVIAALSAHLFSQEVNESTRKKFSTVFDIQNDFYVNVPDSIDNRFFNLGFNFSGLYDHRFGKSNFSFAIGAGLGSHNFYSDGMIETDSAGITALRPFSSLYPGKRLDKNKITSTYFDVPLEFRLRTKKNIRAALGFKVGFLINSHTKYKGYDYLAGSNNRLHVKFKDVDNLEDLRYGITARFGWKFINLTGFYSLTNMFSEDKGPEMYPIGIGISLMPF